VSGTPYTPVFTVPSERASAIPNLRPKDAATLIVIDRSAPTPRVLMGRRKASLKFMPGLYVFPGGRVDADDAAMPHAGAVDLERLRRATPKLTPRRARALALAAIRETYEEAGVLIGRQEAPARVPGEAWAPFGVHGVTPDLDALVYVARAVTPPRRPRRFDTRFFACDIASAPVVLPEGERPETDLEALEWLTFPEARAKPLPFITTLIIADLEPRLMAHDWRSAHHPVPNYVERAGKNLRSDM
jgi:8-oxo-dGTP pyrophosphatase MutT (NUDIX family)